jgi:glycosyltransferase involved in cell wall biosynthesis
MVTHSYYEEDPRVRREAEALMAAGRPVDVYALRRPGEAAEARIEGARVHRIDVQRHQGAGIGTYLREYLAFLARAGWAMTSAHRRRHYALVQVHTMPDFLIGAGLPLRTVGVPLVLDLHEAMPLFFAIRFPRAASSVARAALAGQERLAVACARHVFVPNEALRDRLLGIGVPAAKVTVVPNSPSLARFDPGAAPARRFMADGVLRLVYAGALTPIYELEVALCAIGLIRNVRPELAVRLDVYGRGDSEPALRQSAADAGIGDVVAFHGRIEIDAVPAAIATADVGLSPTRADEYTRLSLSTKIFEYAAMGKPVVATRLPLVERTLGPDAVLGYESGDARGLADAILRLVDDPAEREGRVARTSARMPALSWERHAGRYVELVETLAAGRLSSASDHSADSPARAQPDQEEA